MRVGVIAALALACGHGSAWAADGPGYFKNCDGYPAPTRRGDGIVTGSTLWGLGSSTQDIRRGDYTIAALGLAECDRALADPMLKPEFVLRRANLLQAKAFYQANADRHDEALATLASIEQLGLDANDPLFARGTGLGNRLMRIFVLALADRNTEALAAIEAVERERPYAAILRDTTLKLRLMIDPSLPNHMVLLREAAPTNPAAAFQGFTVALAFGRLEDAVEFGSGLTLDLPRTRGRWTVQGEGTIEYDRIELQARIDGAMAYALAATGDLEGAGRRLQAAREALEIAMAPPPPPPQGRRQRDSVVNDYQMRLKMGDRGKEILDRWQQLMAVRVEGPALGLAELTERIQSFPTGSVPVLADLIGQLGQEEKSVIEQVVVALLGRMHEERLNEIKLDPDAFLELLPRPETPATQVRFKRSGDGYFLGDNGYSRREMDGPDDWTIRFTDDLASRETVEEFGMLAAAEETLKRGYDGFVIQSRRVLERTTRNMYYGTVVSTTNSGREAQLRIRMIHGDELPADLRGAEWRIVRPVEIKAALAHLPTQQPRTASR